MTREALTRRQFLAATTTTTAAILSGCATRPNTARVVPRKLSPNEKLNIAAIGAGGKGFVDIESCASENIVALCDPDWKNAAQGFNLHPQAKKFVDYRVMLDAMPEIDACLISAPDHTHAPAAYRAMKYGKHVYVQKPLTHTVAEAQLLLDTAREMRVMTQMGNQGHSLDTVRDVCEFVWSGAIGPIHEVHSWTDRPLWPQGIADPLPEQPIPNTMDWDVWIGSAPMRPYNSGYAPFNWRGWLDFGTGALGDMACHVWDVVWASLKISAANEYTIAPELCVGLTSQCYPTRSTLKVAVPARDDLPACEVYWHDGYVGEGVDRVFNRPQWPADLEAPKADDLKNGCLFFGADGLLATGSYGRWMRSRPDVRDVSPKQTMPRIPNEDHYQDWIRSCKDGKPACSNFEYSAPLTQFVLLGNAALRAGKALTFRPTTMTIANEPEANALLSKEYRAGYELPV